jgi:hypothetical protein
LQHIDLSSLNPDAEIAYKAFANAGLVKVNLPATLRGTDKYGFIDCSSLQHIDLSSLNPDAAIGGEAFALLRAEGMISQLNNIMSEHITSLRWSGVPQQVDFP